MKKSIFLFFAAILCSMTANAYTVYFNTGNINWADSNAKFQVWTGSKNVDATKIGGNWYSFEVGDATGTMYFKRNSPTGDQWNEFNVSISSTNNCVRLTDWNKGEISSLHVTGDSWNGIGNWSNSNTAGKMIIDGTTFTKTFENVSSEAHKFKLTFKGTWDNAIGYSSNVSCVNGEVADDEGNIKFTPKVAGDVTITYNMADGKIVIECATPKYSVTTSASPAEGGVVSVGGIYAEGSSVTLTATPAEGYEFVNWTKGGAVVSTSKTYTFTVLEDVSLVANFKVPVPDVVKYQVTVSANDNAMGSVTGGGEYEEGATALLTATPNAGYQFVNWTVDETEKSTETTYSFTVTEDVEVVANFQAIPKETVYFVNAEDWAGTIYAYAFTDGGSTKNAAWPGEVATKEANQIGGHDVYSFTAEKGKYETVIFNNNEGKQTSDMTWTAGQYICKNEWCADEAAVLAKLNEPVEYESVYFVNVNGWAAVNIYTWSPEVASWPGVAMTKEAEQLGGYDVYSYTVEKGTTFGGMKFNEGQDKRQTGDLTWTAGKYYVVDEWLTKEEAEEKLSSGEELGLTYNVTVPAGTNACYIAGVMNGWSHMPMTKVDDTHYTITIVGATKDQEYKYCSGPGWDYEEQDAEGNSNNRKYSENDVVVKWKKVYTPTPTALDNIVTSEAPVKMIENGQLFVIKNGVKYNVLGAIVK